MESKEVTKKLKQLVDSAQRILVLQADNPDADSLGSALALESILGDLGKDVALYCGVNIPEYLRYLPGWGRVLAELPSNFDLAIVVDVSTLDLFEKLEASGKTSLLRKKPLVVIDHHGAVENPIDFSTLNIIDSSAASSGDQIYKLAASNNWPVSIVAAESIMSSILGDTQGLTNELTSAETYRTMAALTELGADRPKLEEKRRESGKMVQKIYSYKAQLIEKTEFLNDGKIALVSINQAELNEFSALYNPVPLIMPDLLQVKNVALALVIKIYDDGRITGAIRSNHDYPLAGRLAEMLGGGGHPHASGFKITDGRSYNEILTECITAATELLATIGDKDETIRHSF